MKTSARAMAAALLSITAACAAPEPDPTNELPFGFVDVPTAGTELRPGPNLVGGWALDDVGVTEIRFYFDGKYVTRTTLAVPRPDVAKALPKYARSGDRYGWNLNVDFAATPGPHTILVQAVDSSGATRDIGVVAVTGPR